MRRRADPNSRNAESGRWSLAESVGDKIPDKRKYLVRTWSVQRELPSFVPEKETPQGTAKTVIHKELHTGSKLYTFLLTGPLLFDYHQYGSGIMASNFAHLVLKPASCVSSSMTALSSATRRWRMAVSHSCFCFRASDAFSFLATVFQL